MEGPRERVLEADGHAVEPVELSHHIGLLPDLQPQIGSVDRELVAVAEQQRGRGKRADARLGAAAAVGEAILDSPLGERRERVLACNGEHHEDTGGDEQGPAHAR
jgi:hypothetical protein